MPLKTTQDEQPALNMTPMIDIVFLLIIFFMVGTRFSELNDEEKTLPIDVPVVSDGSALTKPPKAKTVNIMADGSIRFQQAAVTIEALEQQLNQLQQQYPQQSVVVRGDSTTVYQSIMDVLDACRRAEIKNISVAARIAETEIR